MIIKALILPQIQFFFAIIYTPDNLLKNIDEMLFKYLWGNKPPKIKCNTIVASICDGGFAMLTVYEVHATAKNCWIKRLLSETSGK